MLRAALFALLIASLPVGLQAQRGARRSSVHGMGPAHSNIGAHNPASGANSRGLIAGRARGHLHRQRDAFGYGGYGDFPYFLPDYETGWPETAEAQEASNQPPAAPAREERREQERPLPAQVIELPNASKTAEAKPLPPTIFVLTNGEKLETQRYLLTASNLSVTVQREQRTVPLEMLDLDATLAANRDRGIDLRIPNERNEISLRF